MNAELEQARQRLPPVRLAIALPPGFAALSTAALRDRLAGHFRTMSDDLRIPLDLDVSIEIGAGKAQAEIGTQEADAILRLEGRIDPRNPAAAADRIAEVVFENCAFLVTAEVAEALRQSWIQASVPPGPWKEAPLELLRGAIQELVRRGLRVDRLTETPRAAQQPGAETPQGWFEISTWGVDALSLELHVSAREGLDQRLEALQDEIFWDLGIFLPKVALRADPAVASNHFRIQLNDLLWPPRSDPDPVRALADEVRRRAGALICGEMISAGMARLAEFFPELVARARQKFGELTITRVLRLLLDEGVSVRDSKAIFESMIALARIAPVDAERFIVLPGEPGGTFVMPVAKEVSALGPADLVEVVRQGLRQQLSNRYAAFGYSLAVLLVDPALERRIRPGTIPLDRDERQRLVDAIDREMAPHTISEPLVVLTTSPVRRPLRKLIEQEFPQLAVLAYPELSPSLNIRPISRIQWSP